MIINGKDLYELKPVSPMIDHKEKLHGVSYGLAEVGYDVRVAQDIYYFWNDGNPEIHLVDPITGSKEIIRDNFTLASTIEHFDMPDFLVGIVHDKSTWGRAGVAVQNTVIEPCMHPSTEVLTKDGWKYISDITLEDEVLTLNTALDVAEYQKPTATQCIPFSGELLHFKGRSVDQLVTPGHKLYIRTKTTKNGKPCYKWVYEEAKKHFKLLDRAFSRRVPWQGKHYDTVTIEDKTFPAEYFFKFIGAYLGDGCSYAHKGRYKIQLAAVTKDQKKKYYANIFKQLGLTPYIHADGVTAHSKALYSVVHALGHAREKYIPTWIKQASPQNLLDLWDGLLNSDGNAETNIYTTTSKRLADDVQEILSKAGYAGTIWEQTSQTKEGHPFIAWKIRASSKRSLVNITDPEKHTTVPYTGNVYDITVPNHIFMTRREGKMSWTGNCWKGVLTIEITFHRRHNVHIPAGAGIAQIIFHQIKNPAFYNGKYQNQKAEPQDAIWEN